MSELPILWFAPTIPAPDCTCGPYFVNGTQYQRPTYGHFVRCPTYARVWNLSRVGTIERHTDMISARVARIAAPAACGYLLTIVAANWAIHRYGLVGVALTMLGGAVLIVAHPYERCRYSGAGNCWCGRDEGSKLHRVVTA